MGTRICRKIDLDVCAGVGAGVSQLLEWATELSRESDVVVPRASNGQQIFRLMVPTEPYSDRTSAVGLAGFQHGEMHIEFSEMGTTSP